MNKYILERSHCTHPHTHIPQVLQRELLESRLSFIFRGTATGHISVHTSGITQTVAVFPWETASEMEKHRILEKQIFNL